MPLSLSRDSSRELDASDGFCVVVSVRNSVNEAVGAAELFDVGTLVRISTVDRSTSEYAVIVEGIARCRLRLLAVAPPLRTRVELIDLDPSGLDDQMTELVRSLGLQILHRSPGMPPEVHALVRDIEDPGHLIDLVIANVGVGMHEKQLVLETAVVKDRAALATRLLTELLSRLPVPTLSGSQCNFHRVPAVGICSRCGAFICDGCKGPGGTSEVCRPCRARAEAATPVPASGVPLSLALGSLGTGLFSLTSWRVFWPEHLSLFLTCGLVGVVSSLLALWNSRRFSRKSASRVKGAATLGLFLNALVVLTGLALLLGPNR